MYKKFTRLKIAIENLVGEGLPEFLPVGQVRRESYFATEEIIYLSWMSGRVFFFFPVSRLPVLIYKHGWKKAL